MAARFALGFLAGLLALAPLAAPAPAQERTAPAQERTANDGNVVLSGVPEVPPEISERLAPYHATRSAGFVSWTEDGQPGHRRVLYRMDEGGGEFFQLFLLDPRDGRSERLTDGASRNTQPAWSRDGGRLQGQNDPRVPATESEQIVRQVRANGHDVWYMNALNEGHGFARRENQDLMRELVVLFMETHLAEER